MTQSDRSNMRGLEQALAVEEGTWQLTIDGGAVRHPPPAPRGRCPDCEKLIAFNSDGTCREHSMYSGERCPSSGRRMNR